LVIAGIKTLAISANSWNCFIAGVLETGNKLLATLDPELDMDSHPGPDPQLENVGSGSASGSALNPCGFATLPAINIKLRICLTIFYKIRNCPNGLLKGPREIDL
jgi:hypothetical protein